MSLSTGGFLSNLGTGFMNMLGIQAPTTPTVAPTTATTAGVDTAVAGGMGGKQLDAGATEMGKTDWSFDPQKLLDSAGGVIDMYGKIDGIGKRNDMMDIYKAGEARKAESFEIQKRAAQRRRASQDSLKNSIGMATESETAGSYNPNSYKV